MKGKRMDRGIPKEVKQGEHRVAATPQTVASFVQASHTVCIQTNARVRAGFTDKIDEPVGVWVVSSLKEVDQGPVDFKS